MATPVNPLASATPVAAGLPQPSDLLVVQRDAQPHRTTVADLGAAVLVPATATTIGAVKPGSNLTVAADGTLHAAISGAMVFRGAIDPLTTAAPADPIAGDVWLSLANGVVGEGWSGLTGKTVGVGDQLLWDGSRWIANAATAVLATTTAPGVVQLADAEALAAGTAGRVVDAAQLKALAASAMPLDLSTLPPLPA
jgi:hypothetical protein